MIKITLPKSIVVTEEMKEWQASMDFSYGVHEAVVKAFEYVRSLDKERPDAPGGFLCFSCEDQTGTRTVTLPVGEPAKVFKYCAYAQLKVYWLRNASQSCPSTLSTFQLAHIPGGGISFKRGFLGFSGLSPIGDEAVSVIGMLRLEFMTREEARAIAKISSNWIIEKYLREVLKEHV